MTLRNLSEQRYSCRAYTNEPVADDQLQYIMECARLAPSAVNKQPWRFRIVRSAEARARLCQCYNREWFQQAPLYIIVSVRHDEEWVRADGKRHGDIDAAIATEHICLAAAELGLGSCWVCNFDAALCSRLWQMPQDEEPVVLIPIGHPDGEPAPKKRKAMNEIIVD